MGWLQSSIAIVFGVYVLCGKIDIDDHQFLATGSHEVKKYKLKHVYVNVRSLTSREDHLLVES